MYDYVLQYGFDNKTQNYIQSIKDHLKANKIDDKERAWLPHITIDLYDCKNEQEFIDEVDKVVNKIQKFNIEFKNLNNFKGRTLYIEPYNTEILMNLKSLFNTDLDRYRLENRREKVYTPHATLCTNDTLEKSLKLVKEKFYPFSGIVKYIWIYNEDIKLIKEYELK